MKKTLITIFIFLFSFCACSSENFEYYTAAEASSETISSELNQTVIISSEPVITSLPLKSETTEVNFQKEKIKSALTDTKSFDEQIDGICQKYYTTGMSMAIFADGEIIYVKSYGFSDLKANIKASAETKYRSASISKTITAVCAMTLADKELLDIDSSISSVLGFSCDFNSDFPNTSRHLMTHTSSIIDAAAFDNGILNNPPLSLEKILKKGVFENVTPGTRYEYSNYGFGIISAIVEGITGERFYTYAENEVFKKLGIDAGYIRTLIEDNENIANIYQGGKLTCDVKTWGRTEKFYDLIPLGQQYGLGQCELIISATDLAQFGIILSGDGSVDGINILSKESVEEMNKPYITVENEDFSTSYGLGLRICEKIVKGRTITGHPGNAYGMVSGLYFDCSDSTGVAILTNGCSSEMGEAGIYKINYDIVNAVYDYFFNY